MRTCFSSTLASLSVAALLAGCGGDKTTGVFTVKKGMTKQQVHQVAGMPYRAGPHCWLYHASKKGTPIDAMRFCFRNGEVSLIQTGVHL
jgi:hypothetical protein